MRPYSFVRPAFALVLSCTLVVGCGLLKKKGGADGGDDTGDAATVTVTGSGAKNEKDVLRYASEVKLADEPGTIGKDGTKAKTFPASGADVATLANGTAVTKIAKFFSTGVLITFVDPTATDGSKLMGWVAPEALAAPAAGTPTTTAVNTAPRITVAVDAGAKDAGLVDAGATAVADAGKAVADAGIAPPTTVVSAITALPNAGKCPAGFVLVGPLCRKPCTTDADCKGAFCTSSAGKKTCSATK